MMKKVKTSSPPSAIRYPYINCTAFYLLQNYHADDNIRRRRVDERKTLLFLPLSQKTKDKLLTDTKTFSTQLVKIRRCFEMKSEKCSSRGMLEENEISHTYTCGKLLPVFLL